MKTPTTVTASLWHGCNYHCRYCVAGCHHAPDEPKQLSFAALNDWLLEYRPGAIVHLAGGEPLARDDIEYGVDLLCHNFRVVILTNGSLIPQRAGLHSMPVAWLVTYHHSSTTIDQFIKDIEPIKDHPIRLRVLVEKCMCDTELSFVMDQLFDYDVDLQHENDARKNSFQYVQDDLHDVASRVINLVEPDGNVYACNYKRPGPIGNVYQMTFDEEAARKVDAKARNCVMRNRCGAYQTAVTMNQVIDDRRS